MFDLRIVMYCQFDKVTAFDDIENDISADQQHFFPTLLWQSDD
jgi:hypothetical protein